jgi:hypothetical protein
VGVGKTHELSRVFVTNGHGATSSFLFITLTDSTLGVSEERPGFLAISEAFFLLASPGLPSRYQTEMTMSA